MTWDQLPHTTQENLFGGTGTVRIWNLLGQAQAPPFTAVLRCELAPGGQVGLHRQQRDPELVICLEGNGQISMNQQTAPFAAGAMIYLPLGHAMSLQNLSDQDPLQYFIIKGENPK